MSERRLPMAPPSSGRAVSATAATVAIGAIACGVCCALPFALPAVMLASTGGLLALFAQAYWWALYIAVAMVLGAWLWVGLQTWRTGQRPARNTVVTMMGATAAVVVAAAWPLLEPLVIAALT
ncbi:MAG: hypothetical protein R2745_01645 [Vicinamibacterales bacterium]